MKVLYTGTLDVNAGGPAFSTYNTMRGLNAIGVDTHVLMYEMEKNGKLIGNDVPIHFAKKPIEHIFSYSPFYKKEIKACGDFDIYQAQGVWLYNTYALVDVAQKLCKPYVITPRGMLYPQDIAKSKPWFKKMSLKMRLLNDLNNAACVHVTCEDERMHCRNLGVTAPIAIIPNPVEIKDYPCKKEDKVRRIGYIGRLSPRKNVEGLIRAFADFGEKAEDAELLIIGGGDEAYESFLKHEVERLHLSNVVFAGFLNGEEKDKALASCSVIAMPSEFENLGNVILEGLVRRIPCIATTGSPWKELNERECGWWVEYSQEAITAAVEMALEVSEEQLARMGNNGRRLMEERYSVEAVAECFERLYMWILGKAKKPEFITLAGE